MEQQKVDRRVNRTRRLLRESLMKLVVQKGYDAVTIEDITEMAELGRTTFYLHYKDKEELLLESIDAIADDLTAHILQEVQSRNASLANNPDLNQFRPIVFVFEHARDHRMLYQIILRGEGSTVAASRIRKIIYDAAMMFFEMNLGEIRVQTIGLDLVKLIAAYFSSALLGFLTWWLETETDISPEEMGEYFRKFFFYGVRPYVLSEF